MSLDKKEALGLLDRVRANHSRLTSCPSHQFELTPETATKALGRRYRCAACAGEIDIHAYFWFSQGVEHGKRQGP